MNQLKQPKQPILIPDGGTTSTANGVNINSQDIATLNPDALMNDNIVTVLLM